jgi:hypothetical protein
MTAREIIRELEALIHDWADDPETTTADYVCVQADRMLAQYTKRAPLIGQDREDHEA